jgi:hypothetical protein
MLIRLTDLVRGGKTFVKILEDLQSGGGKRMKIMTAMHFFIKLVLQYSRLYGRPNPVIATLV